MGYDPYGGYGGSRIPTGPFGQLAMGAGAFGQSMQGWAPMIMDLLNYKIQKQYQPIQAAAQQLQLVQSLYKDDPTKWIPAMQHYQDVANASGLPGYKDFKFPMVSGAAQPAQMGPVRQAPEFTGSLTPGTGPFQNVVPGQTLPTTSVEQTIPALPPKYPVSLERPGGVPAGPPKATGFAPGTPPGPYGPTGGPPPSYAPGQPPVPSLQPGPQGPRQPVAPPPQTSPYTAPTMSIAVPGQEWATMRTDQMFPDKPMQDAIVQIAGTPNVLRMPYVDAVKLFPRIALARASQNASTLGQAARNAGMSLPADQMAILDSVRTDDPSLTVDGVPSPFKVATALQAVQEQGANAVLRAAQLEHERASTAALTAGAGREARTDAEKQAIQAYGAAVRMGDTARANRILATLPQGVDAGVVQQGGQTLAAQWEASGLYYVNVPGLGAVPVVGGDKAAALAYEGENQKLRERGLAITEQEAKAAQERLGWERFAIGQKANAALDAGLKLNNSDVQVLMQFRMVQAGTLQLPPKALAALQTRAVQIMRSKMGMNITVDDLKTAAKPGAPKVDPLSSTIGKIWDFVVRRRFGTAGGLAPAPAAPAPGEPALGTDEEPSIPPPSQPLSQGARALYIKWAQDGGRPVPAWVAARLKQADPSGYNYLISVMGLTVDEKQKTPPAGSGY